MKFLHTADLHIGKKLFEQSLIEDQKYILDEIYEIALREQVDAVVIAGDVYDRAIPSTEAVTLLDDFLTRLVKQKIPVFMISGNHDSPERVSFAERILEGQGLYVAGTYEGQPKTVTLEDEYGPVTFVLLPFVKPAVAGGENSAETVKNILERTPMTLSLHNRYVLVTHYFVLGEGGSSPELSDSESDSMVGGLDGVPGSMFQNFSYVALGHIHKPQHMGGGKIYYSGSPLKYSFSEALTEKSVNLVTCGGEGAVTVEKIPLSPLRDLRCIRGNLSELMSPQVMEANRGHLEDYLQVTLTDTEELIDPIGTLRSVYPNVLQIVLEKNRVNEDGEYESRIVGKRKSTAELFNDFYELIKGEPMDEKRRGIVADAVETSEKGLRQV